MDKKEKDQLREFSRIETHIQAKIVADGKEIVSERTRNISMKGIFVETDAQLEVGTECEIHMFLEGKSIPVDIMVKGRVQRVTDEGMGCMFTEVGLDAYEHIHNLILLNTEDPEKIEQEFKSHLGLKKKK